MKTLFAPAFAPFLRAKTTASHGAAAGHLSVPISLFRFGIYLLLAFAVNRVTASALLVASSTTSVRAIRRFNRAAEGNTSEGQSAWTVLNAMNRDFPDLMRRVHTIAASVRPLGRGSLDKSMGVIG